MPLPPINRNPDAATLSGFSEGLMVLLGMIVAPWSLYQDRDAVALVCWVVAVLSRVVGLARPMWLRPVFVGLSIATRPIGWVVSHLLLAIIYYGLITPIGLALRVFGHDPLDARVDRGSTSSWKPYPVDSRRDRFLRPF